MSKKKYIAAYLKEYWRHFLLYFIFVFIFFVIFLLYQVSVSYILYPASVCLILWMIVAICSCFYYYKDHKTREKIIMHIDVTLEDLPKPKSLLELDYQEMLLALTMEKNKAISERDKKSKDIQEYITLWSHQMKTPITAMGLLVQEMEGEKGGALSGQLFEMERYVDTVLQYLRLDTMNSDLLLKEYEIIDIVRQAVKYHSKSFISKHISLRLEEIDSKVVTDEKWLLFVLKQILSNALKYTNQGSISIYMEKSLTKTLVIEDTGIGISLEDIPRIFERGFTGYNGRMDKKATGIGLYLSKQILDKLQHEIAITSNPAEGTKVYINLTKL